MNMYKLIRPRISHRRLRKEDTKVLQRIFGKFGGTGLKLKALEATFLRYLACAQGSKHGCDAKEATMKVVSNGLLANLPDGYAVNADLQKKVQTCFADFVEAVRGDFTDAGMEDLSDDQVDSLVVGHMVYQYGAKGKLVTKNKRE